jgi:hypothetical protein
MDTPHTQRKRIRAPKPTVALTVLGPISVDVLNSLVKVLPRGTMISQTESVTINGKPRAVFDFIAPALGLSAPLGGPSDFTEVSQHEKQ